MKSAIKKLKKRAAFSLMEALVVLVIIGILSAVTFIAVSIYQRNMQLLKMDAIAKEMFIAAQNHLSMAEGQGFLDIEDTGADTGQGFGFKEAGSSPEVRFLIVAGNSPTLNDPTSVFSLMLPVGSIDESVRTGGNYIIRYQKEPARILDVFYAENSGRFAHEPSFDDYQYEHSLWGIRENSDERKDYDYSSTVKGAVIGYYGGAAAADIPVAGKVKAPSLSVENGDKLQAVVTWTKSQADEKLFLVIRGLSSGAETSLIGIDVHETPKNYTRSIVLDDISGVDTCFCDVVKNSTLATKFWPGEDIEIYAKAQNSGGLSNVAYSAKLVTNSLFASLSGSPGDKSANISSIRHLENLDPAISSLDVANLGIKSAVQQNNLSWAAYRQEIVKGTSESADNVRIYNAANAFTSAGCYMPINPSYLRSYDGLYGGTRHKIDGIKVSIDGDAGLFGALTSTAGIEIKNLELLNFDVKSTAGNAGTLAGSINSSALLSEILVRNDIEDDSTLEINAENSAGGLVGAVVNSGTQYFAAQYCAASVYVESSSGAAGGLIGSISNSGTSTATITGCYSGGHTEDGKYADTSFNVISNTTGGIAAGGLIGDASSADIVVGNSYSTCSVKGATPGGFIGKAGDGSISNCYSTGKVSKGGSASVFPFAGDKGSVAYSGNEYLQGISGSEQAQSDVATGKSSDDLTPATKGRAVPYDSKVMAENIDAGGVSYKFKTIANMIPTLGSGSFVSRHYGDWQKSGIIAGPIKATIVNGNDLIAYLELPRTAGMSSAEVTLALKRASSPDSAPVYISYPMKLTKGGEGWTAVLEKPGAPASVQAICNYLTFLETASSGEDILKIGVVLDSVTKQGAHFTQLTSGSGIEPGEDIAIRACSGKVNSWGEIANDYEVKTNSLFADKLPPGISFNPTADTAKIAFARHLLNLDPLVSGVRDGITAARLTEDVSFTGIGAIYSSDGSKTANSYHPIYNKNLTAINGYWHAISGINYDAASDGISGTAAGALTTPGKGNAGLFRLTDKSGGFAINELAIKNCSFETTGGHAGSFVAETTSSLNLDSVLAYGASSTIKAVSASMMNRYDAGGLVGRAGAGLTVNNSAASVLVRADIPSGTYTSGAAGGLVGHQASGNLSISDSYAGGHTSSAKYNLGSDAGCNVFSDSGAAGGLCGKIASGSISVTRSFSAASVASKYSYAGGIFGEAGGSVSMSQYVYSVAPVRNAATSNTQRGVFAGRSSASVNLNNAYYLPEIYGKSSNPPKVASGSSSGTAVGVVYYPVTGATGDNTDIEVRYNSKPAELAATVVYDPGLKNAGSSPEYPFSVWTQLKFESGTKKAYYYGDWEPIKTTPTYTAEFFYYVPQLNATGGKTGAYTTTPVPGSAPGSQYKQYLLSNAENKLAPPYPRPEYDTYPLEFKGWYISGDLSTALQKYSDGWLKLTEAQSNGNIDIYGVYDTYNTSTPAGYYYRARFYSYDPGTGARPLISDQVVFGEGKTKTIYAPEPPVLKDHVFVGWYSAATGGTAVFTNNSREFTPSSTTHSIQAYARYEKVNYEDIKVNFVVSKNNSDQYMVNLPLDPYTLSLPRGNYNTKDKLALPTKPDLSDFSSYINYPSTTNLFRAIVCAEGPASPGPYTGSNNDIILRSGTYIPDMPSRNFTVHYDRKDLGIYTLRETFRNSSGSGLSYHQSKNHIKETTKPCTPGMMTAASAGSYEGFYAEPFVNKPADPNGNTVVDIVYARKQHPIIYSGLKEGSSRPTAIASYGQFLSAFSTPPAPTEIPPGCIGFKGWVVTKMNGDPYPAATMPGATMPDFALNFKASWLNEEASYMVVYWKENADDGYTVDEDATDYMLAQNGGSYTGAVGTTPTYASLAAYPAYASEYEGFKLNTTKTDAELQPIKADGSTIINVYYERETYKILFCVPESSGGTLESIGNGGNFSETGKLKFVIKDSQGDLIKNSFHRPEELGNTWGPWSFRGADFYRTDYYPGHPGVSRYFRYLEKRDEGDTWTYGHWFKYEQIDKPQGYTPDIANGSYYLIEYKSTFGYAQYYMDGNGNFYKMDRQDSDGNYIYYRHVDFSLALESELNSKYPDGAYLINIYEPFTIEAKHGKDIHDLWPSKRSFSPSPAVSKYSRWSDSPDTATGNWYMRAPIMPLGGAIFFRVDDGLSVAKSYHDIYLEGIDNTNYTRNSGYSTEFDTRAERPSTTLPDYLPMIGFRVRIKGINPNSPVLSKYGADNVNYAPASQGNFSDDYDKKYSWVGSPNHGWTGTFLYERKSYTVSAFNDSGAASAYSTQTYKFEKTLYATNSGGAVINNTLLNAIGAPTPPGTGYTFAGWYSNKYYAGEELFPETANYTMKMPARNIELYAKWISPESSTQKTVSFNLNTSGTPSPSSIPSRTVNIGVALNTIPAVATGNNWSAAYTPTLSGYIFDGWFTEASAGRRFMPTEEVSADMILYARWKPKTTTLTIKHVLWNPSYGSSYGGIDSIVPMPSQIAEADVFSTETRSNFPVESEQYVSATVVGGYTPVMAGQKVYVSRSEENPTIYFFYTQPATKSVDYTVEYHIVCGPLDLGSKITIGPIAGVGGTLHNDYETVYFSLPAGYENYHQVTEDGIVTANLRPYEIVDAKNPVATFYISPNFKAMRLPDASFAYNGMNRLSDVKVSIANANATTPKEGEHLSEWKTDTFKMPATGGGVFELRRYVTAPTAGTEAKLVGEYSITAELYLHKGTTSICVWRSTQGVPNATLRITKMPLILKSGSATFPANNTIRKHEVVNVYGPDDMPYTFPAMTDEPLYIFAADAFRKEPGVSTNAFDYRFSGLAGNNYIVIRKDYGTITVE